ncbi:hypothetical protein, partial [Nitrobacter winogradskyi]|uniref:Uncharacterized protein n=1 Tax=Nitrobacter winogradskyi TaxID=913 RepID=A0ACC6ALZ1_NITWI
MFVDRNILGPLSSDGQALLQNYDLQRLAADRLRGSPAGVQNAVITASLQGLTFSTAIVEEIACAMPPLRNSDLS